MSNGNNRNCTPCINGVPFDRIVINGFDSATAKVLAIPLDRLTDIIIALSNATNNNNNSEFIVNNNNFALTSANADRFISLNNATSGQPSILSISDVRSGQTFNLFLQNGLQPIQFYNNTGRPLTFTGQVQSPDGTVNTVSQTFQQGEIITPLSVAPGALAPTSAQYNLTVISRNNGYELVGNVVFARNV